MKEVLCENKIESTYSLAKKIDTINEYLFYKKKIPKKVLKETILQIRNRQVTNGESIGMLSLTPFDYQEGSLLFTGEKLKTNLATKNTLTQEAFRLLILVNDVDLATDETIKLANKWMEDSCFSTYCFVGECKHSTLGFIRYLNTIKTPKFEEKIRLFLTLLKEHRDNKGRWDGFPFYYTLLVLSEISIPEAISELCYA
ncbi:MAG: hypothetical protein FK730_13085, partial [Asgard group archaeon]|nr:hypothetical protein [Asgard group archaeon]